MASTVAFVTGANRGLGLGLVKGFVAKPDYVGSSLNCDFNPYELQAELGRLP